MLTEKLPADLTLYVLSFLPFSDIATLHICSRAIHQFIDDHEEALYHQLAVSHRYAEKGRSLKEVRGKDIGMGVGMGTVKEVHGWKEFCRTSCTLTLNWTSRGSAVVGGYTPLGEDNVRQFVVDEKHGILFTLSDTTQTAGVLTARTLDGERVVWTLSGVSHFVHSDRFLLIRPRVPDITEIIEVWQITTFPSPSPTPTSPNTSQPPSFNLTFALHATLPTPQGGWRTFAFHAPLIALISREQPHLVHIFDLSQPSSPTTQPMRIQATQLIDLDSLLTSNTSIPDPSARHMLVFSVLLDLQLSDKYLCACFDTGVVVAKLCKRSDRGFVNTSGPEDGRGKVVGRDAVMIEDSRHPEVGRPTWPVAKRVIRQDLDSRVHPAGTHLGGRYVEMRVTDGASVVDEYRVSKLSKEEQEEEERRNDTALVREHRYNPNFISAQFSPNGKHLIIGTTYRYIYLFTNIDRMFDAGITPREIMQKVVLEEPVRVLKWEGHETVFALRDDENDIWLYDLCPTYHTLPNSQEDHDDNEDDEPSLRFVGARALRVTTFGRLKGRASGTLQVRSTGVWVTADLKRAMGEPEDVHSSSQTVCFLSFDTEGMV